MSEQALILVAIVSIVAIVALVAVLALIVVPRREAGKNVIGGIDISGNNTQVNIGQGNKAPVVQGAKTDFKQNVKLHLYLFTYLPPSFFLIGVVIWWRNPNLSDISNILTWATGTLLVPAIIGEFQRPARVINRLILLLDMALLAFLILSLFRITSLTIVGIMTVISIAIVGLALAAGGHSTDTK